MRARLAWPVAAAVLALGSVAARSALEPEARRVAVIRDPSWLPNGKVLRLASFGQRLLLSDLYWLKTVSYMGETLLAKSDRWDALYPLTDIVTDLDPRHGYAYQVAGSNLAGLAHRYAEADRILLKGMQHVPDRWTLPFTYASNKFIFEHDYATAAEYARRAAVIGKRPHLALLAANLAALVNTDREYDAAIAFLDQAIEQAAGQDDLELDLRQRRLRMQTWRVLARVETAAADFQRDQGRPPLLLADLLPYLGRLPEDPSGGRIELDPATGKVRSTVIGERKPLQVDR